MDLYLQHILKILRTDDRVAKLKELDSPVLRDLMFLAYSPSVTLKVPAVDFETPSPHSYSPDVYQFHKIFTMAADNINCPEELGPAFHAHLLDYPVLQRKVMYRFLTRTLGLTLTVTDINQALPHCIPEIHVQPIADFMPGFLKYPLYCVPLYPGTRIIAVKYINNLCFYDKTGTIIKVEPEVVKGFASLNSGIYDIILTDTGEFHLFNYTRLHERNESPLSAKEKAVVLNRMVLLPPLFAHSVFKIKTTHYIRKYYKYYKDRGAAGLFLMGTSPYSLKETSVFVLDSLYGGR